MGGEAGVVLSGEAAFARRFSSEFSIFGYLVFIACPSRRAPDAFCGGDVRARRSASLLAKGKIRCARLNVARQIAIGSRSNV